MAEFVEKPAPTGSTRNLISAGAYVLEREVLELVPPGRNVSIEREVWPRLIGKGSTVFPRRATGWTSARPSATCKGTFDIIEGNVHTAVRERLGSDFLALAPDVLVEGRAIPPAVLEPGVRVAAGAHVGSLVVLGQDVTVGAGSTVERAVILNGTEIGPGCTLRDCIVAAGCRIGEGTQITGGAVLGEGVTVGRTTSCPAERVSSRA